MSLLNWYQKNHHARALVKMLPRGAAFDYWLFEQARAQRDQMLADPGSERLLGALAVRHSETVDIRIRRMLRHQDLTLVNTGTFALSSTTRKLAGSIGADLVKSDKPDDLCAVVSEEPDRHDEPLTFRYRSPP
jgi:hypothetical protein